MNRFFKTLALLALVITSTLSFATPVYAADCGTNEDAKGQVMRGLGQTGSDCTSGGVKEAVKVVVHALSLVAGAVAVIVIILSGFKYITSGGDSSKVGVAKTMLIYAVVGIAVVALAQVIVRFTIAQSNEIADPTCATNSKIKASDPSCK